jgi:hypothetical protein
MTRALIRMSSAARRTAFRSGVFGAGVVIRRGYHMGRPGAMLTRMNSHGWIFWSADSVCYRVCRFQQNSTRNRLLLPGLS